MKYAVGLLSLVTILLVSCEYEAPLTKEHNIAIDSAVLGLWELIQDEGEESQARVARDERKVVEAVHGDGRGEAGDQDRPGAIRQLDDGV